MARRFLIAPDKFKGSLSAREAADAMASGVRRVFPDAEIDLCPIADGGEGFMETLAPTLHGRWISCPAVDALGREIESRYLLLDTPQGTVALMEMAETAGLWRLKPEERNPLLTTTRGTGLQIAHAVQEHGVCRIVMGIGGSATNDGGFGMAAALGVLFLGENGKPVAPTPTAMGAVSRVIVSERMPLPEIVAACDVETPLLGPTGATAVFSAQKGAQPEDQILLEAAMTRLVAISAGESAAVVPGAGAAGGLGFGLLHFADAKLVGGFDLLADLLGLEARIHAADFVLTGEGSLDHQSLAGKGPVALARLAGISRKPAFAFCGAVDASVRESGLFQKVHALAETGLPHEILMENAALLVTEMVAACGFD